MKVVMWAFAHPATRRFRTHCDYGNALANLLPSDEIAEPNAPGAKDKYTKVDYLSICDPAPETNTTLDFYHLLLVDHALQIKSTFTNLGVQQCGEFMHRADPSIPLGQFVSL